MMPERNVTAATMSALKEASPFTIGDRGFFVIQVMRR
jgi:hypothetical protein